MTERKRLNLLWREGDWQRLDRVQSKLGEESASAALRRALQVTEAVIDGRVKIDGRDVLLPV